MRNYDVVESSSLSKMYDRRYVVVDTDTGEILDDAQGYGYKSRQKAHAAWSYKNRDRSKDAEKKKKRQSILRWMKEHEDFVLAMDQFAFEIAKGSWGPDDIFDAKLVGGMLKARGYETDFTAAELLRVWRDR